MQTEYKNLSRAKLDQAKGASCPAFCISHWIVIVDSELYPTVSLESHEVEFQELTASVELWGIKTILMLRTNEKRNVSFLRVCIHDLASNHN